MDKLSLFNKAKKQTNKQTELRICSHDTGQIFNCLIISVFRCSFHVNDLNRTKI